MPLQLQLTPKPCAECGAEPVYHAFERWSLIVDRLVAPITRPLDLFAPLVVPVLAPAIDIVAPLTATAFARLGLGTITTAPDQLDNETTVALWREADARGITMRQFRPFGLRRNLFLASYQGRSLVFEGLPRPARHSSALAWMDDKAVMKKRFSGQGFPVPRDSHEWPLVVKPRLGSGGRHTAAGITNDAQLARAIASARQISPRVMVEEQLDGPVYRATLIDGKLVAVLRRDPPQIVGDGIRTIRELVDEENKNPLRAGPVFAPLRIDRVEDPDHIPAPGEVVFLHWKVNWGVGGTSHDATDETHPDNAQLFHDIAEYLDDDIIGIDFIIADISRSWRETPRCGVIEVNSQPFIGNHHFPFTGPPRNVAGAVWDLVYPQTKTPPKRSF